MPNDYSEDHLVDQPALQRGLSLLYASRSMKTLFNYASPISHT